MAEVKRSQNLIVSYMGANRLLVHQISTGGGLNLSFQEAQELIQLLANMLKKASLHDRERTEETGGLNLS